MSLEQLKTASQKTIGAKQTLKGIEAGRLQVVYVAKDADERVVRPLVELAMAKGTPVEWVETMQLLGKACGIQVGSAAAGLVHAAPVDTGCADTDFVDTCSSDA